jgi:hypothetical protein
MSRRVIKFEAPKEAPEELKVSYTRVEEVKPRAALEKG